MYTLKKNQSPTRSNTSISVVTDENLDMTVHVVVIDITRRTQRRKFCLHRRTHGLISDSYRGILHL